MCCVTPEKHLMHFIKRGGVMPWCSWFDWLFIASPDTSAFKGHGSFALTFCKNLGHQGNFQKFGRASRQS